MILITAGSLQATHSLPSLVSAQAKVNSIIAAAVNPKNTDILTSSAHQGALTIHEAQLRLAKAIQEDKVPKIQLSRFYNSYRNISDDARLLSQFPEKTAEAFRLLHKALQEEIQRQMKKDGKGADFFQAPAEKSLSPEMVSHAIALEQLNVSPQVTQYIDQVSHAREVTTGNIQQVAQLCDKNWPCIEKAAYTWIKNNQQLTQEQHQLIQQYNTGS